MSRPGAAHQESSPHDRPAVHRAAAPRRRPARHGGGRIRPQCLHATQRLTADVDAGRHRSRRPARRRAAGSNRRLRRPRSCPSAPGGAGPPRGAAWSWSPSWPPSSPRVARTSRARHRRTDATPCGRRLERDRRQPDDRQRDRGIGHHASRGGRRQGRRDDHQQPGQPLRRPERPERDRRRLGHPLQRRRLDHHQPPRRVRGDRPEGHARSTVARSRARPTAPTR